MLSQKTKYALRALTMLAAAEPGELTLVQDIADHQQVPKKFLELILLELKRHGFVHSQRGRNGGYVLARPADTITWGQIIRAMDGPLAPVACASVTHYRRCADCADEQTCTIRKTMLRVRDAMSDVLDHTTLDAGPPKLARVQSG